MKRRLGLYEKSMPDGLSWREKLAAGREAGFDWLEMSVDESDARLSRLEWSPRERRELVNLCRETDFYIDTICLSGHRKYPIGSARAQIEARGMRIMEQAIELAYDLGARIIQLAGYDVYYDEDSTPCTKERFMQNLWESTRMAASRGVILALETMENDFMNTIGKAMYYVNTINSPYLKIYPDMGNITNATGHIAQDIRAGRGHIAAAHLKETRPGVFRNLHFGEGNVDFKLVTDVLKAQDVAMFTAEFWYDGNENWKETLRNSHDFLRPYLE